MKTVKSFTGSLAAAVIIMLACATIAAAGAGSDTCAGVGATIGGTCTPLTNTTSASNFNSAFGENALLNNNTGLFNTAIGAEALLTNTSGSSNTATGVGALRVNTTGSSNTAAGLQALFNNTTGSGNTATGDGALSFNIEGGENTATGEASLLANTAGSNNTATGGAALLSNTTGNNNTAAGMNALGFNTVGGENTADGLSALLFNLTGGRNTATGLGALGGNTSGSSNIGIGFNGGRNLTTGDNNIDIFDRGVEAEADTIRIGTQGTQTTTYIAGIFGGRRIKKGCDVVADNTGLIGCAKSSARYKRDIRDMGDASDKLMKLRPVTFHYKGDSTGIQQYGLIAEEVEKIYPELVIDDTDGKAETVAYHVLPAMLLNEVQKQARVNQRLARQLAEKDAEIAAMHQQIVGLQKKNGEIDALAERINTLEQQARRATPDHLASAAR